MVYSISQVLSVTMALKKMKKIVILAEEIIYYTETLNIFSKSIFK